MNMPIKGVAKMDGPRPTPERRKSSTEEAEMPKMSWQTAESGAVEVALQDGRLTLTEGLFDEKGQLDEVATEERILDMAKEGISFDSLNDVDQEMARRLLEGMQQDFLSDPDMDRQLELVNQSLDELAAAEFSREETEEIELQEKAEAREAVMEAVDDTAEAVEAPGIDPNEAAWFESGEGGVMGPEESGAPSDYENMMQDSNAFDFAISHAEELGFSDLKDTTFAEIQKDLSEKESLQKEIQSAGFFKKMFGLGSAKIALARINNRLGALERLSGEMNNFVAMEDDRTTDSMGTRARDRAQDRRQETNRKMRSGGKGRMF